MTKEEKLHRAAFRIIRDRFGVYRVECLDQTCDYWYIVASKMGTGKGGYQRAVEYCNQFIEEDEP